MMDWTSISFDDMRECFGDTEVLNWVLEEGPDETQVLEALDLELIEQLAESAGLYYTNENKVSKAFDQHLEQIHFFDQYKHDDEVAINECFSYFVDDLHTDDYLTLQQVNNYEYIGKWS